MAPQLYLDVAQQIDFVPKNPPTEVQDPGRLFLTAPTEVFQSGFSAGPLTVTSVDPCTACSEEQTTNLPISPTSAAKQ